MEASRGQVRHFSFPVLHFLSSKDVFYVSRRVKNFFFQSFTHEKENVSLVPSGLPYTEMGVFVKKLF